ncbi:2-phospho-L-lactate transferase [Haloarcula onubensis]|uniref:2-phospho-L-lactate transferase n=1 Tax=Haloarcula onubensis TaxID=2950539 RepID=A0ABU2FQR8_9EURY|nr:2-phospho-L-lactate transferase [Halomicroarcula sp. S3CR25-11]MDS0283109.1 2-phospho-L-lactate transferase [Halomicroarcula sp. S3CR25-11]
MVTFLAGGTGTPKLLAGAGDVFAPERTTVVGNTGDDVELGGHLVCPDLDTVLFLDGGELDRETWWGIAGDSAATHDELHRLASAADLPTGPQYLPEGEQTAGRDIARWRRFSGVAEFMHIGDRDRAVHVTRTSLLDAGHSLTEVTRRLADAFGLDRELLPMSDDPVATLVHTPQGPMHFQEWWVGRNGAPIVDDVEFRGGDDAGATDAVLDALEEPVVVGPSNPVTSLGPMLAVDGIEAALSETPVVAVSPFVEREVFSGPAADLMAGVGRDPSTAGVAEAYPFADAFVLDSDDGTDLDRPVVRTDTTMDDEADSARVARAVADALAEVA